MLVRALERLAVEVPRVARVMPITTRFFSLAAKKELPEIIKAAEPEAKSSDWHLIYDGQCPMCSASVKRLKTDGVVLVNARLGTPLIKELEARGFNFDKKMGLVLPDGAVITGPDALRAVAKRRGGIYAATLGSELMNETVYRRLVNIKDFLVPESIAATRAREAAREAEILVNTLPPLR